MRKKEIEEKIIKQGLAEMPEIDIKKIANEVIMTNETKAATKQLKKKQTRKLTYAFVVVLILVLIGTLTGTSLYFTSSQSEIFIDINPSFKILATPTNKVKKYIAISDDSKELFDTAFIEGKSIDVASEYIFATLFEKGYINENNDIYISSVGKNLKNATKAMQKVKETAEKCLKDKNIKGKIHCEDKLSSNKNDNISPAKAAKIKEILSQTNFYSQEELENKSMSELNKIIKSFDKSKNYNKFNKLNNN